MTTIDRMKAAIKRHKGCRIAHHGLKVFIIAPDTGRFLHIFDTTIYDRDNLRDHLREQGRRLENY